jgi:hypothetical protein
MYWVRVTAVITSEALVFDFIFILPTIIAKHSIRIGNIALTAFYTGDIFAHPNGTIFILSPDVKAPTIIGCIARRTQQIIKM